MSNKFHSGFEASEKKYGRLPARYAGLGRFTDSLSPSNLRSFRVFPPNSRESDSTYMLTTRGNIMGGLSVMRRDLESLLDQGLVRIQSNDPGEVSFYFNKHYTETRRSR